MINDGIQNGNYKGTEDKTLDSLKVFMSLLYQNFKKYEHYEKMLPKSNQPGQLCDTGKTHKLNKIEYLTLCTLKFHFIIAQIGRHVNASHVMAEYLKPLCSDNEYIIRNTQKFPKMLHQQERLLPNEGYV